MTDDISKYGFFVVIGVFEGYKDLCYDFVDHDYTAKFTSEKDAIAFVESVQKEFPQYTYYHKYVSWNMYD